MAEKHYNILITSAGRRVKLVHFFQEALRRLELPGRVLTIDVNPLWSAASRISDRSFCSPPALSDEYGKFLEGLVRREGVSLIIPTIDTELLKLSRLRKTFAELGCSIVVSDAELITTCRDKRKSHDWFRELGFATPSMYEKKNLSFPCFVKPYDGSMSQNAQAIISPSMLSDSLLSNDKLMFMEYYSPNQYDEFTIDSYFNCVGDLKCLVPRKRVEVRGGEISKGIALKGNTYKYLWERLQHIDGARGCLTFQFFSSTTEDRWAAIELNPRFGGGYPLSHYAGANYAEWLVREYLLKEVISVFEDWKDRTAMVRYDSEVFFEN